MTSPGLSSVFAGFRFPREVISLAVCWYLPLRAPVERRCASLHLAHGFLEVPAARASDALVDRKCLPQAGGPFAGIAILDLAVADTFQGACFLQGGADITGDDQRLRVVVLGLVAGRGTGQQFAEVVQRLRLAEPVTDIAVEAQRAPVAGGGGRVVPGESFNDAELVEGTGLALAVTEIAKQRQRLRQVSGGPKVVPGLRLCVAQVEEGEGLAAPLAGVGLMPRASRPAYQSAVAAVLRWQR